MEIILKTEPGSPDSTPPEMPLAQHKHHRDARAPGAPVGGQRLRPGVFLRESRLSLAWGSSHFSCDLSLLEVWACIFSFCIKLCRWHLAKPCPCPRHHGQGRGCPQPAARRNVNRPPPAAPANRAHLLLKPGPGLPLLPRRRCIHPSVRATPSVVTSAPTGQWAVLLGHACALLPRWGSSSVMLARGIASKNIFSKSQISP